MKPSRDDILEYVLSGLQQLAKDWDYSQTVGRDSHLFRQMGLESLDVVVLGVAIQEHYGREMPFAELLASIGQREVRDLSVGELVEFIYTHLGSGNGDAQ